jgi:hypothetical protein
MGMFNPYCGLSNLPIAAGYDTILVTVKRSEGALTPDWIKRRDCVCRILRGSYNAYGSLDEYEEEDINYADDADFQGLFFLAKAWEYAVQAMKDLKVVSSPPPNDKIDETLWYQWLKVLAFANDVGRNLAALTLDNCSCQHGSFELNKHRALLLFSNTLMEDLYDDERQFWGKEDEA